jgi:hypothetical protein
MLFYRHLGQVICAVFKFSGQQYFRMNYFRRKDTAFCLNCDFYDLFDPADGYLQS